MEPQKDEVLAEYLGECREMIDRVSGWLSALEKTGHDRETQRRIARDVHTLKGSSQLFGFRQIGQVTHAMEECLDRLKEAASEVLPSLLDRMFAALDVLSRLFAGIQTTGLEPDLQGEATEVARQLEALGAGDGWAKPKEASDTAPDPAREATAGRAALGAKPSAVSAADDAAGDATIRVNVELLDNLMNVVGELVLVRNQLQQLAKFRDDGELHKIGQRLSIVTGEIQNDVMKTRMQPIGGALAKFHRVVRDASKSLGKQVELKLEGTDTELDKTLIEAVRDPLMHIVRNAIDHGIEMPAERRGKGKPESGTIVIRALHESGHVLIEISDDGRGLSRDKIGVKAVERGLATAEACARLADRDVYQFIFLPGFSTAEKVSNLSGRGVGMDVVRTNVEGIGGTIELSTVPDQGMTVRLRIPLTLAIIPALLVQVQGEHFAIPQVKLLELLLLSGDAPSGGGIELLQGRAICRLRGRLLPLIFLGEALGLEPRREREEALTQLAGMTQQIAVLSVDHRIFGLAVDLIEDSADIVVKPLPSFLKDLGVYSGATVLGDGRIALTLDAAGLAERAGFSQLREAMRDEVEESPVSPAGAASGDAIEYLLVEVGGKSKYGIPLCLVKRLEEFPRADVQYSGEQQVIRYREHLLPLLSVAKALGLDEDEAASAEGKLSVVVVRKGNRDFGLVVREIIDVVLTLSPLDLEIRDRYGLVGSLIEGGQVVTMIDALAIIDAHLGKSPTATREAGAEPRPAPSPRTGHPSRARHHVLVVEDGSFFRRHVTQLLKDAGYRVTASENGAEALELFTGDDPAPFTAIVSDIEMPEMTGLELARSLRARGAKLPMIALSSRFSAADVDLGLRSGFNRYIEKLKPDELVAEVDGLLGLRLEA